MNAYHGKQEIKEKYLNRVTLHERADEIIKGQYWHNGKGCAVGCTIYGNDHSRYESELGIPTTLARLEDSIFEGLPNDLAKTWPRRFLESIPVGADLSMVWSHFAIWLLVDEKYGVLQFAKTDDQKQVINSVADLYVMKTEGAEIDINDWLEARAAAYATTAYATTAYATTAYATTAYATTDAYADTAATAATAADAAAYAATAATTAYAYAYAYAADLRREEHRIAQSEKLIELLKSTKPKGGG